MSFFLNLIYKLNAIQSKFHRILQISTKWSLSLQKEAKTQNSWQKIKDEQSWQTYSSAQALL